MTKLGIVVGEDNWTFFGKIFEDLALHFHVDLYRKRVFSSPLLSGRLNSWAVTEGLRLILRRNDICFFEWASELLVIASHLPKRCAIVTRLHSFELFEWARRINWDAVDRVVLVSRAMQNAFAKLYPNHHHKTCVVYNGQSSDEFKPPLQRDQMLDLGMLCEIAPIKRVYEAILAFYDVKQRGYSAHLHIAGETNGDLRYLAAVRGLVEKLNLQHDVTFYGHVKDVASWLRRIDVFISNSLWEGQQVALLEAMATGCHCLSHFWSGAEEVLPQENLYTTELECSRKIIEYADKSDVEKLKCHDQLRSRACKEFDLDRTKRKIRQVVMEVTSNGISKKVSEA